MSVRYKAILLAAAILLVSVLAVASVGSGGGDRGQAPSAASVSTERPTTQTIPYASLEDIPEKLSADGTTITVGDPEAPITVHLYEDPRCPYCKEFEATGGGPVLINWMVQRKTKVEYTMASFLDDRLGGSGSQKAVNALRAALEAGKFAEYHELLYRNQPEEVVDGFTSAYLLKLASEIDGLRSASFDSAVEKMEYRGFVAESEKAYEDAGRSGSGRKGPGTPTAEINGMRIPEQYAGLIYDQELFTNLLERVAGSPV